MAARKSKKTDQKKAKGKPPPGPPLARKRTGEVVGLLLIGAAILVGLSLYSYHTAESNWVGPVGVFIAEVLVTLFGYSSYVAAVGLVAVGLLVILGKTIRVKLWEGTGYLLLTLAVAALLYLHAPPDAQVHWGGATGMWIGSGLAMAFAKVGATILLGLVAILALILATHFSLIHLAVAVVDGLFVGAARLRTFVVVTRERRRRLKEKKVELDGKRPELEAEAAAEIRRQARRERLARLKDERESKLKEVEKEVAARAKELEELERQAALRKAEEEAAAEQAAAAAGAEAAPAAAKPNGKTGKGKAKRNHAATPAEVEIAPAPAGEATAAPAVEVSGAPARGAEAREGDGAEERPTIVESPAMKQKKRAKAEQRRFKFHEFGDYELPSIDVLDEVPDAVTERNDEEMYDLAKRLEIKLADYGVNGKVVEIHPGPVVTMYEYKPGRGVRVSKIANLATDLAMALEAQSVRIVAPIPGKAVVGIEVPNSNREIVYLKEIIASDEFASPKGKLVISVGKDIRGAPVCADLAKMPHLLVAGTTGSGKSVMLHTLLCSILFRCSPDDVRLLIVDPKMIDMIAYDRIPHLLLPVVTDMKKAPLALAWAVEEMERRYRLIAKYGARNINTFNKRAEALAVEAKKRGEADAGGNKRVIVLRRKDGEEAPAAGGEAPAGAAEGEAGEGVVEASDQEAILKASGIADAPPEPGAEGGEDGALAGPAEGGPAGAVAGPDEDDPEIPQKLPYIVIIVDEFGDLMTVAAREVESSIQRLAQKARAAGIHLVLATQRPDANVITGIIKANFPSRIAFRVLDQLNSRVVLDQKGAEALLNMGDMLYLGPGTSNLERCHGAFVSEDEVSRLVEKLREQGKPTYNEEILKPREDDEEGGGEDEEAEAYDVKWDEAVAVVTETRKASISFVQRKLQIGYNRAARMIERMEKEGIVSAPMGSKGREVIAPPPPKL